MTEKTAAGPSRLLAQLKPEGERAATATDKFTAQINRLRGEVAKMIGQDKVDKFIRVVQTAVQNNPDLLMADRKSLLVASMEAAQDGLLPDGSEAVFNVYRTTVKEGNVERKVDVVQYLPMAYGLIQRMYEIPGVVNVDAVAVYDMDDFDYERGDEPKITHKPYSGAEEPGKVKAAYCVVKFKTGERKREVMWRRDIEKVRKKSRAPSGLMWDEDKGFYDQGAIKSVIHRIFKQLPQAERLRAALAHDNKHAGLAEVAAPAHDPLGTNFDAVVESNVVLVEDKREDQAHRTLHPGAGAEKVVEGAVVAEDATTKAAPAKAAATDTAVAGGAAAILEEARREAAARPKPGEAGTPELEKKIHDAMARATSKDTLDIAYEDVRHFKWSDEAKKALDDFYRERTAAFS